MKRVAVVFCAEGSFGAALCRCLLGHGWEVCCCGNTPFSDSDIVALPVDLGSLDSFRAAATEVQRGYGGVDLLVAHCAPLVTEVTEDFASMLQVYDTATLGTLRFIEAFLPLTERGLKRLCFATNVAGRFDETNSAPNLGEVMATAAFDMQCKILFNDLRRDGYTFRLFLLRQSVEREDNEAAEAIAACQAFLRERENEDEFVALDSSGKRFFF